MITLFPITYWKNVEGTGTNGTNNLFICWARRNHPFAGAIMAQEIYESRFKTVRVLGITAAIMVVASAALFGLTAFSLGAINIAVVAVFSLIIAMLFTGLYPAWQHEVELRGQSIECTIRFKCYNTPIDLAIDEAATQLLGYGQFEGWSHYKLSTELSKRVYGHGYKWVADNSKLVQRCLDESTKV